MENKNNFVYIVGKHIREPHTVKPCVTCALQDSCVSSANRCTRYSMWFAGEWHRIQRMFKK